MVEVLESPYLYRAIHIQELLGVWVACEKPAFLKAVPGDRNVVTLEMSPILAAVPHWPCSSNRYAHKISITTLSLAWVSIPSLYLSRTEHHVEHLMHRFLMIGLIGGFGSFATSLPILQDPWSITSRKIILLGKTSQGICQAQHN